MRMLCMKILAVHPNFELYGSDRWFAAALLAMEAEFGVNQIRVVLPQTGPIETLPPFERMQVDYFPMFILRRKRFWSGIFKSLAKAPMTFFKALSEMNKSKVTYINTIIPIDFILMARFSRRPVILHVHEIPVGKELEIFRLLVLFSKARLIFNSKATLEAFRLPKHVQASVVYNGYTDPGDTTKAAQSVERKLQILVIGRINRWKGQEILVEALQLLPLEVRAKINVRIVGSAFEGSEDLLGRLKMQIAHGGLGDIVSVEPFEDDPSESYRASDVVIVPSRLPEPFGRVAIEAMAYGCAVIASNHGGLAEIVVEGETGKLVEPASPIALAEAITTFSSNPSQVARMGANGRARFQNTFTQQAVDRVFLASIAEVLGCGAKVDE